MKYTVEYSGSIIVEAEDMEDAEFQAEDIIPVGAMIDKVKEID